MQRSIKAVFEDNIMFIIIITMIILKSRSEELSGFSCLAGLISMSSLQSPECGEWGGLCPYAFIVAPSDGNCSATHTMQPLPMELLTLE